jgi:hypothetical protein
MTRIFAAALAAVLLTCARAAAQLDTRTLPEAATLTGSERMPAVQGSGCTTKTTPCASVAVTPSILSNYLQSAFQVIDTDLSAIAALTTTTTGRDLLTSADAASIRSKAGLGTAATANIGTSGTNVPYLSSNNRWGQTQTFATAASSEYLLAAGASVTEADGVAPQRFYAKPVNAGQLVPLGAWAATENATQLLITVSSTTSGHSGTSMYLLQAGYSFIGLTTGAYYRLIPFSVGYGHGDGPDTGFNGSWQLFVYPMNTGNPYQNGLAIAVPAGSQNKILRVTVTELRRGLTYTDLSTQPVVTTWTQSGSVYGSRQLNAQNMQTSSLTASTLFINTPLTPASATAACTTGQQAWDASYSYVCVATNSWKRASLAAW